MTFAKGFTDHEKTDASGLIYMQARFYVPQYHRFSSPDPAMDQHPEDPQSWNLYSYCLNDPVMRTDPTGMTNFPSFSDVWKTVKSYFSYEQHTEASKETGQNGQVKRKDSADVSRKVEVGKGLNLVKANFHTELNSDETTLDKKTSFFGDHLQLEGKVVQTKGTYESDTTGNVGLKSTGVGTDLKVGSSLTFSGTIGLKALGYQITIGGEAGGGFQIGGSAKAWDLKPGNSTFLKVDVKPGIGTLGFSGISFTKVTPDNH